MKRRYSGQVILPKAKPIGIACGADFSLMDESMLEYFNVNRLVRNHCNPLKKGDVINTADKLFNPYHYNLLMFSKEFSLHNGKFPFLNFFNEVASGKLTEIGGTTENIALLAQLALENYVALVRELHFENIRREEFPGCPSRNRCIWLASTIDDAKWWQQELGNANESQILRVEIEHETFTTNDEFLKNEAEDYKDTIANARKYWRGLGGGGKVEHLYEGRMTVVEVMA